MCRTLLLTCLVTAGVWPGRAATQTTFTVNSTSDPGDAICDAAQCTLREAISAANLHPGSDRIAFAIPGPGPHSIKPLSQLPFVTDPLVIDGYTQPGASPNTNPHDMGSNAVIRIEIDGSQVTLGTAVRAFHLSGSGSTVRGFAINRFHHGIRLAGTGGHIVEGNFIGTDVTGTVALPNAPESGVTVVSGTAGNRIGGTASAARNVISGNDAGVFLAPGSLGTVVEGNLLGTDATGTLPLGNTGKAITAQGSDNRIGGTAPGAGNVISGNDSPIAIAISLNVRATGNRIQGNRIGTDVSGTLPLPNTVAISTANGSSMNTIGGIEDGAGNTIAYNGSAHRTVGSAVFLGSGVGNAVLGNRIYGNNGLGIDLFPEFGVMLNDPGDTDVGANNAQNYPRLTLVEGREVSGALGSAPSRAFRVEFFGNSVCDPSGHGEGEVFLGWTTVNTDGAGDAQFTASLPGAVTHPFLSATATDPDNNTSEFSACLEVAPDFLLGAEAISGTVTAGGAATYTVTVDPAGAPLGEPVSLSCSGLPLRTACSFAPAQVVVGASGGSSTLTISTTAAAALAPGLPRFPPLFGPVRLHVEHRGIWLWFGGGLLLAGLLLAKRAPRVRRSGTKLVAAGVVVAALSVPGCGESTGDVMQPRGTPGTPPGSYTVTVVGQSGSLQRTATATLVVQ